MPPSPCWSSRGSERSRETRPRPSRRPWKSSKTTPRHCGAGGENKMSARMDTLAARQALLIAPLRLQRLEVAVHAGAARETLRPASLVASAIAKPAALVAIFEVVAPVLGLKRYARWARFASVAFAVSRIVNTRRSDSD